MVQLVWHVNAIAGCIEALNLAEKFTLYKTLTQLAYKGDEPEHYERLYRLIDSKAYKIEWAMRAIYDLDKQSVVQSAMTSL